ncbi:hemin uptake protein HemP [Reinekea thalattae]|nr:hemin uptake protein HemP [Reinekea thalattae]
MTKQDDPRQQSPEQSLEPQPFITSKALLNEQKEVLIIHNDSVYRLQETSSGKLILTK